MHGGTEGYRDSKFEIRKFDKTHTNFIDKTEGRQKNKQICIRQLSRSGGISRFEIRNSRFEIRKFDNTHSKPIDKTAAWRLGKSRNSRTEKR